MKNIRQILDEVLKDIEPDKNYQKDIFARLNSIINAINKNKKGIKAVLGGSGAKGTWLKTFDADIFALFDYGKYKDKSDKLSQFLEPILKKRFKKIIRLHGSRDYFQIKEGIFTFEIVPILNISKAEQAKNITDVSPLHSKWVSRQAKIKDFLDTKNTKRFLVRKNLVNEMKLTKQFCQAQNVYGAESYIRAFSGYVCEILTVNYGSFLGLLKNAAKWKEKEVIDVERYYKGGDVFKIMNMSKLVSPLVVVDPVQKDRNAAAALSQEKFNDFRKAANEFLRNPSRDFFIKKDLKSIFINMKSKKKKLIVINARPLEGKIDVVGTKLLKIFEFLKSRLARYGFDVVKSGWEWDKKNNANLYFLFGKEELPEGIEVEGPPLRMEKHAENFRRLHRNTLVKNGKLYAIGKRKFRNPEDLFRELTKDEYIKTRSKSIKIDAN